MHNLMCAYRKMYVCTHYEYAGLNDSNYKKELSWGKKIICKSEYAADEVMDFLQTLEKKENGNILWKQDERFVEEDFLAGRKVIIKTIESSGFFSNLFQMGAVVNIWNNAHHAKSDGIPVLKPVALVEKRSLKGTNASIIYLYEGIVADQTKLSGVLDLQMLLFQKHITHHDFHLRNIVILEDGAVQLIDLDKMHWYPRYSYLFSYKMKKEKRRFSRDLD